MQIVQLWKAYTNHYCALFDHANDGMAGSPVGEKNNFPYPAAMSSSSVSARQCCAQVSLSKSLNPFQIQQ